MMHETFSAHTKQWINSSALHHYDFSYKYGDMQLFYINTYNTLAGPRETL